MRANWLTQKPWPLAKVWTLSLGFGVVFISFMYFNNLFSSRDWMIAKGAEVFFGHEYWRLWTSILVHGDLGHLISNLFPFLLFSYFLLSYFSGLFFPVIGFLIAGINNYFVLLFLQPNVGLLGISGLVYWMGATYLTLFLLIDRRHSLRRRFAYTLFLTLMLFVPQTYRPEISYLSHVVGFVTGIASAFGLFFISREKFNGAEVLEFEEPSEAIFPVN